jgi:hypothetical protein
LSWLRSRATELNSRNRVGATRVPHVLSSA